MRASASRRSCRGRFVHPLWPGALRHLRRRVRAALNAMRTLVGGDAVALTVRCRCLPQASTQPSATCPSACASVHAPVCACVRALNPKSYRVFTENQIEQDDQGAAAMPIPPCLPSRADLPPSHCMPHCTVRWPTPATPRHRRAGARHPAGAARARPDGRRRPPAAARPRPSCFPRSSACSPRAPSGEPARERGVVYGPRVLVLDADPRTRDAGRQGRHSLRPPRAGPARRDRPRRRALPAADQGAARPARHPDRHAGPPARPPADRQGGARQRRDPGPRRSRPHARHGLHRRHHDHRRAHAEGAPDADVQRHLRRQRRPPGAADCCATRRRSTCPRTPTPTPTSSSACTGPTTARTRTRCSTTS